MLYRGKSYLFPTTLKRGNLKQVSGEARTRPQFSLTSKPDTQTACCTVHHIRALESSVLNSETGPKMSGKIPEATERNKAVPPPLNGPLSF